MRITKPRQRVVYQVLADVGVADQVGTDGELASLPVQVEVVYAAVRAVHQLIRHYVSLATNRNNESWTHWRETGPLH